MGLCQYIDLCFHASSLPCLHTFWHAIPTSFTFLMFSVLFSCIYMKNPSFDSLVYRARSGLPQLALTACSHLMKAHVFLCVQTNCTAKTKLLCIFSHYSYSSHANSINKINKKNNNIIVSSITKFAL